MASAASDTTAQHEDVADRSGTKRAARVLNARKNNQYLAIPGVADVAKIEPTLKNSLLKIALTAIALTAIALTAIALTAIALTA